MFQEESYVICNPSGVFLKADFRNDQNTVHLLPQVAPKGSIHSPFFYTVRVCYPQEKCCLLQGMSSTILPPSRISFLFPSRQITYSLKFKSNITFPGKLLFTSLCPGSAYSLDFCPPIPSRSWAQAAYQEHGKITARSFIIFVSTAPETVPEFF